MLQAFKQGRIGADLKATSSIEPPEGGFVGENGRLKKYPLTEKEAFKPMYDESIKNIIKETAKIIGCNSDIHAELSHPTAEAIVWAIEEVLKLKKQ
jgi:hypothetical protein